jgi:hypothetical protein
MTLYSKKILISASIFIIICVLFYVGKQNNENKVVSNQITASSSPEKPSVTNLESNLGTNEYKVINIISEPKAAYSSITLSTSPRIFKLMKDAADYKKYITFLETAKLQKSTVYVVFSKEVPDTVELVLPVPDAVTFVGRIEHYDTGCFADATCSITIDNKKIILITGGRRISSEPVGLLLGVPSIGDLEKNIGKTAKVYAKKLDEQNYTLYGNENYFVSVQQ